MNIGDKVEIEKAGTVCLGEVIEKQEEIVINTDIGYPESFKIKLKDDWVVGVLASDIENGKVLRSITLVEAI